MASSDLIDMNGTIIKVVKGGVFIVETDNKTEVTCKPNNLLRIHEIKLVCGDKVGIQVSPYDLTKGRILKRL